MHRQGKNSSLSYNLNQTQMSELVFQSAVLSNSPVAIWRNPGSHSDQAVVGVEASPGYWSRDLNDQSAGFVMAPFATAPALQIPADFYFDGQCLNCNLPASRQLSAGGTRFEQTLSRMVALGERERVWFNKQPANKKHHSTTREEFCNAVDRAKTDIAAGRMEKVVLSRLQEVPLDEDFNPCTLFHRLALAYPNAFVSLVAIPGVGTWLGATPELLLGLDDTSLRTVALAATCRREQGGSISELNWGEKERLEQSLVSDYVHDCLAELGLDNYRVSGAETVRFGDILHLQTSYSLSREEITVEAGNKLLASLHPTPAVCGAPKAVAQRFVQSHERHCREFYSGYLGPVNLSGRASLFVNLRCLQLLEKSALLYAGAGITADSTAEREWAETDLKLHTLLRFLARNRKGSQKIA